jgi:hypothetical protein
LTRPQQDLIDWDLLQTFGDFFSSKFFHGYLCGIESLEISPESKALQQVDGTGRIWSAGLVAVVPLERLSM